MAQQASWAGTASDLLRAATNPIGDDEVAKNRADWPKNPGILAGRLRRAQTFLRTVVFMLSGCRAWQISRSGPRLVKQHCGLLALSRALTPQTAGPPLRASSRPIP